MTPRQKTLAQEALARINQSHSEANYAAVIEAFTERGIDEEDILPKENVLTYRAWQAKGRQVRKGEKSVKVTVFIVKPELDSNGQPILDGDGNPKTFTMKRNAAVFHVSQTDARAL